MSNIASAELVRNQMLLFLMPLFLKGVGGDTGLARASAVQMLDAYAAAPGTDMLVAAQVIAFAISTLDALGQAMAEPDLSVSARLRLRSNANALHRSGERCRRQLGDAPRPDQSAPTHDSSIPAAVSALEKMQRAIVEAAPALAQRLACEMPVSRQQRRYLARKAGESLHKQEQEARRNARISKLALRRAPVISQPAAAPYAGAGDSPIVAG